MPRGSIAAAARAACECRAYRDHQLVFCRKDGHPIEPDFVSQRFRQLVRRTGLPQIRFRDLWHTFATLSLKARIPHRGDQLGFEEAFDRGQLCAPTDKVLPTQPPSAIKDLDASTYRPGQPLRLSERAAMEAPVPNLVIRDEVRHGR